MGRRIHGDELDFTILFQQTRTTSGSVDYNKFRLIHGRECSGDGLDRVQDPQLEGVLGS